MWGVVKGWSFYRRFHSLERSLFNNRWSCIASSCRSTCQCQGTVVKISWNRYARKIYQGWHTTFCLITSSWSRTALQQSCVSYSLARAQLRLVFRSMTWRADCGSCDLISIHTQFRLHRIGIVADVAKMHRTIKLCSCDQKLLLILWMTNADKPIEAFQLTTIIFSTYTRSWKWRNIQTQRRCYYKIFALETWSLALKIPKKERLLDDTMALTENTGFTLRKPWKVAAGL